MSWQALALDLDGTLLIGEELPERNRKAVAAAHEAGLAIIIATARWRQMAERIAEEIGISAPIIACSGAQVFAPELQTDIFDQRLPEAFTRDLYALCNENRCIATITLSDLTQIKLDGEPDLSQMSEEMHWVRQLEYDPDAPPRIAAIQGSKTNEIIKTELWPKYREQINLFDSIGPSGKIIITITASGANKGKALLAACDHASVPPEQVIAFGDAENDIEMFKVAGASVAMGQADDTIKAAATITTDTNLNCGVGQTIERYLATGQL